MRLPRFQQAAAWTPGQPLVTSAARLGEAVYVGTYSLTGPWLYRAEGGVLVEAEFTAPARAIACRGLLEQGGYLYMLLGCVSSEGSPLSLEHTDRTLLYRTADGVTWTLLGDTAGALCQLAWWDGALYSTGNLPSVADPLRRGLWRFERHDWRSTGVDGNWQTGEGRLRVWSGALVLEHASAVAWYISCGDESGNLRAWIPGAGYQLNTVVYYRGRLHCLRVDSETDPTRQELWRATNERGTGWERVAGWQVAAGGLYWSAVVQGNAILLLGARGGQGVVGLYAPGGLELAVPCRYTANDLRGGVLLGTEASGPSLPEYQLRWGTPPEVIIADLGGWEQRIPLSAAAVVGRGCYLEALTFEWADGEAGGGTAYLEALRFEWPTNDHHLAYLEEFTFEWADGEGGHAAYLEEFGFDWPEGGEGATGLAYLESLTFEWPTGDGSAPGVAYLEEFTFEWADSGGEGPDEAAGETVLWLEREFGHEVRRVRLVVGAAPGTVSGVRALVRPSVSTLPLDAWNSYQQITPGPNWSLFEPAQGLRIGIIKPDSLPADTPIAVQTEE